MVVPWGHRFLVPPMSRRANVLPSLALALLLGASILAVQPTTGYPVSAAQQKAVDNLFEDETFGEDAPDSWQVRTEVNRFYLGSAATTRAGPAPGTTLTFSEGTPPGARLDLEQPTIDIPPLPGNPPKTQAASMAQPTVGDHQALVALPDSLGDDLGTGILVANPVAIQASFPLHSSVIPTDRVRVYEMDISVFAACDTEGFNSNRAVVVPQKAPYIGTLDARVQQQVSTDGGANWAPLGPALIDLDLIPQAGTAGSGQPGVIQEYRTLQPGRISAGAGSNEGQVSGSNVASNPALNNGPLFEAGIHRFVLTVSVPETISNEAPGLECILHYGTATFPSVVRVKSDSMRMTMTTLDSEGRQTEGFPSPATTDASHRRIILETVQASPWGSAGNQMLATRTNARLFAPQNGTYLHWVENANDNKLPELDIRIIELQSRNDEIVGDSLVRRTFSFVYPGNLTESRIEPQVYSLTQGWDIRAPEIQIGGRGITFKLLGASTHEVNPKEPTEFRFLVTNTGTEDDSVAITATDPGSGWVATVLGGGQVFVKPGGKAIVVVEVTPPPAATTGQRSVTVRASSSFLDVPDPSTESVTVRLVSELRRGVNITTDVSSFSVRPGLAKGLALTVRNNGTARDSFVVLPNLPSNIQGWTVVMSPTSLQIPAGSTATVTALIRAPGEAPSGLNFPLGLTAVEVGDSSVFSRVDIPVNVFSVEGLLVGLLDGSGPRLMREDMEICRGGTAGGLINTVEWQVGTYCMVSDEVQGAPAPGPVDQVQEHIPDDDSDNAALFRLAVENLGDAEDAYRVTGFWDTSEEGTSDLQNCELDPSGGDAGDGIPDGWRYNWGPDVGEPLPASAQAGANQHSGAFSGIYTFAGTDAPIVVPARSTHYQYVEIGYVDMDGSCTYDDWGTQVPHSYLSSTAKLVVTFQSVHDASRKFTVPLVTKLEPAGDLQSPNRFAGGKHDPVLEPELDAPTDQFVQVKNTLTYQLRAINKGNEKDDLILRAVASNGWAVALSRGGSVPDGVTCDNPTADGTLVCRQLGVYDEVLINVTARPPELGEPGDRTDITVTVASGDAGGVSDTQGLIGHVAGTFAFAAGPRGDATRTGAPGTTVPLPFAIRNLGTEGDTYRASLLLSDPKWTPVLSTGAGIFVPALNEGAGYVGVIIPADAPLGTPKQFRVAVDSVSTGSRQVFDLFATPVAPGRLSLVSEAGQDVLLPARGTPQEVDVRATLTSGGSTTVRVTADQLSLPPGWAVAAKAPVSTALPASTDLTMAPDDSGRPTAVVTFLVTAPDDAISTSRGVLRLVGIDATGDDASLRATTDVVLNLASTFGLELNATDAEQIIAPGGDAIFDVKVSNLGLGPDTVRFTRTALPAGWAMVTNPGSLSLGPLESSNVTVKISAPTTAAPKANASIILFATSVGEPTTLDSVQLKAEVGFNELKAVFLGPEPYGSPQETLVYALNVTNTGNLPDEVKVTGALDTIGLSKHLQGNASETLIKLEPGESREVVVYQTLGASIPSGVAMQSTMTFTSLLDERAQPAKANVTITGHVLKYALSDVNGDSLVEYAVDRDQDDANGFEQFQATTAPGGLPLALPDLQKFLRDDARESFSRDITLEDGTVERILVYTIDGDEDGRVDHFLDKDGDDQPDFYWDPDANKATPIEFRKDINGDQVPESFVDVDGEGSLDAVFDLTRGTFTDVIQLDVDGDGELDYVVDRDGDGNVDQDETVLYTRTGKLLIVQKVDVDGDGKLDQVFDTDGDGNPDYFIPNGSTASVPIVLRDVNGDGVQDWTFDGDDDGRNESYYDPATGKAHVIDAAGHFTDALAKYWYIGALFALVLVLFVALVLVTRR